MTDIDALIAFVENATPEQLLTHERQQTGMVSVFFAPAYNQWILRKFHTNGMRMTDEVWQGAAEPTDTELLALFAHDVRIVRGRVIA
jgi:hypothetical protein